MALGCIAIVQARMGSTRLPGKVLAEAVGRPLLWHLIQRLRRSRYLGGIVIATTTQEADRAIVDLAQECGVGSFTGSEEDVLDRYYQAAKALGVEIIVHITADCPLIDPQVVDRVIGYYLDHRAEVDFVSNGIVPTYPDGLDVGVYPFSVLERAWREAKKRSEREHATSYIWTHPEIFRLANVRHDQDLSRLRWTVDEERDLRFVREVFRELYREGEAFAMSEVLELLRRRPELLEINAAIGRNEGYLKSLREEA